MTSYAPGVGFRYEITGEGGSSFIRSKVLRAVLDGERDSSSTVEPGALRSRRRTTPSRQTASMQMGWQAC